VKADVNTDMVSHLKSLGLRDYFEEAVHKNKTDKLRAREVKAWKLKTKKEKKAKLEIYGTELKKYENKMAEVENKTGKVLQEYRPKLSYLYNERQVAYMKYKKYTKIRDEWAKKVKHDHTGLFDALQKAAREKKRKEKEAKSVKRVGKHRNEHEKTKLEKEIAKDAEELNLRRQKKVYSPKLKPNSINYARLNESKALRLIRCFCLEKLGGCLPYSIMAGFCENIDSQTRLVDFDVRGFIDKCKCLIKRKGPTKFNKIKYIVNKLGRGMSLQDALRKMCAIMNYKLMTEEDKAKAKKEKMKKMGEWREKRRYMYTDVDDSDSFSD
jgi:hypothetical protein